MFSAIEALLPRAVPPYKALVSLPRASPSRFDLVLKPIEVPFKDTAPLPIAVVKVTIVAVLGLSEIWKAPDLAPSPIAMPPADLELRPRTVA